jgi:hypothetical protein
MPILETAINKTKARNSLPELSKNVNRELLRNARLTPHRPKSVLALSK